MFQTPRRFRVQIQGRTRYQMRIVCHEKQEGIIRTILLRHINSLPKMAIQRIAIEETERSDQAVVVADIFRSTERPALEDLMSRVNIEPSVTSASWGKMRDSEA